MCSDRDPDPPNILESDVMFVTLNYVIKSSVWHMWGREAVSGGKFT